MLKSLSASNFIRKETPAQVFRVNFTKFLRSSFLQNTSTTASECVNIDF